MNDKLSSGRPADHQQRLEALNPTESIICEAPAGSGKTELLTQRLLTLLGRVRAPENIVAITFTKKAASEMRSRVLQSLVKGTDPEPPEKEHERDTWQLARGALAADKEFAWHLLENPNRLRIVTFDSLNSTFANSLPFYSSFSVPPAISDQPSEDYRQAARALLASLEHDAPWSDSIAVLLSQLDNNSSRLEALLMDMLDKRENWLPLLGFDDQLENSTGAESNEHTLIDSLENNLQCVRRETVSKLHQRIPSEHQQPLLEMASFAASNLLKDAITSPITACHNGDLADNTSVHNTLPGHDPLGIEQWHGIVNLLLTNDSQWRKSLNKNTGFPPGDKDEKAFFKDKKQQALAFINELKAVDGLDALLADLRHLPDAHYDQDQSALLSALTQLLPILSAHLSVVFKEHNRVDFNEVSLKALLALGAAQETSELALALDYQVQHLLVDEFQDTSPTQISLLKKLTEGWQSDDAKTLFCVGDAMQSIYSFRKAEVGLFIHAIEHGLSQHLPLKAIRLSTNFRSQKPIIDWVNSTFEQAFPEKNDISEGAVSYFHSVAFNQNQTDSKVTVTGFTPDNSQAGEAQKIIDIIRKTRKNNPKESIAILVNTRSHARHILPALKKEDINYRAVDLESLKDTSIVQDLLSLSTALLYPGDRIAWLSLLRAPWCGLSLADLTLLSEACNGQPIINFLVSLAVVKNGSDNSTDESLNRKDEYPTEIKQPFLKTLSADGQARLGRIAPIMITAHHQRQRKTIRQWIEGTWLKIGGPAALDNKTDIANAELFFSHLNQLSYHELIANPTLLNKSIESLYALPDSHADDSLQIMTIHKAKGLEFDTVIIPSLHRLARGPDKELLRWQNYIDTAGHPRLIIAPITASGKNTDATYNYLVKQQKKRDGYEACRKFYVACTRARRQLYLLAEVKNDHKPPAANSLLACIWPSVKSNITTNESVSFTPILADQKNTLRRLVSGWQPVSMNEGHLLANYIPYYQHSNLPTSETQHTVIENIEEPPLRESDSHISAKQVGTLVHQLLHYFASPQGYEQLQLFNKKSIEDAKHQWKNALITLGVSQSQLTNAVDQVGCIIEKISQDEKIHWMLGDSQLTRKAEYSITQLTATGYQQKIIDLLLFEKDIVWLVDYKTSEPSPDQGLDAFLTQEKLAYQDTMFAYKKAVMALEATSKKQTVKRVLYFPMIGVWAEYDD